MQQYEERRRTRNWKPLIWRRLESCIKRSVPVIDYLVTVAGCITVVWWSTSIFLSLGDMLKTLLWGSCELRVLGCRVQLLDYLLTTVLCNHS
jgi:hypothetical protein